MPAAATVLATAAFPGVDNTQRIARVYFSIAATGTYAALGDPLDISALKTAACTSQMPLFVAMQSQGSVNSGYLYEWLPNSATGNGKFQVMKGATGPIVDLGAGAYPAAITGDTIVGYADFPRL